MAGFSIVAEFCRSWMYLAAIGWEIPVDMQRSIIPQLSGITLPFRQTLSYRHSNRYKQDSLFPNASPFRNGLQSVFNRLYEPPQDVVVKRVV